MQPDLTSLIGRKFGLLRVIRLAKQGPRGGKRSWVCRCRCGNKTICTSGALKIGDTKSCGCQLLKNRPSVKEGDRYFKLKVISRIAGSDKYGHSLWKCRCDCGNVITRPGVDIKHMKTCGCIRRQTGMSHTPEYAVWVAMLGRCEDEKDSSYTRYGGRGIRVCDKWKQDFFSFLNDMGPRPSEKHTIERVDNSGPYSPENCCWALPHQQARNKRSNVWITYEGETMILQDWADGAGLFSKTLANRLARGWSMKKALATPARKRTNKKQTAYQMATGVN